ncbi:MAG: T9SS type A sorting domain-containing protein [Bacteroidales bacterium]
MKNYIFSMAIMFLMLFCHLAQGQPTLSFKMDNPHVLRSGDKQWFMYDVYLKASAGGTLLYATQLAFGVTDVDDYITSPISNLYINFSGGILNGTYGGNAVYIALSQNWVTDNGPKRFGFSIVVNSNLTGDPSLIPCAEVTTLYQKICTVGVEISETGLNVACGITWNPTYMPVSQQQYCNGNLPGHLNYSSPNDFYSNDFANVYLARVYSSAYGWSQYGGPANNSPYIYWTTALNTSVWDTISTGGTGEIASTDKNCQASNLRIHPGAKLKIAAGGELKVAGNTQINQPRGLWIASDGTSAGAFMDNGEGSVTYGTGAYARIDRHVGSNNWHLIGFPLHIVNPQATFLGTYLKWYNETMSTTAALAANKWTYVNTETNETGDLKGWSHWSNYATTGDYTIKYAANGANHLVSGALTHGLTRTAFTDDGYDGWNLVANMYPCPIDWDPPSGIGWTRTSVDPTIYMWSESIGNYAQYTYNGSGNGYTLNGGTRYIPSMQGFFVHATAATTFGMNNNVKVFNSQAFWKDQIAYNQLLDLNVDANSYKDEVKVWFNNSATVNFEPEYDTYKLWGLDEAPQLYCVLADGNNAAINALPWGGLNTVVPMGFSLNADTLVTITASNMESFKPGTRIFLEDKKVANTQELTVNPVYTFTASPNDDANRFVLHFYNPSYGIEDKNLAGMQIYSFEDYVYVRNLVKGTTKGEIQIYDLIGRKVFQGMLKDMELNKYLPGVDEGYYMVRVVTVDHSYTKKVYLK